MANGNCTQWQLDLRALLHNIHLDSSIVSYIIVRLLVLALAESAKVANELVACQRDILIYYVCLSGEAREMERHFHYA